jgi:hypothetical protein
MDMESSKATENIGLSHVLLIDLENCPNQINHLMKNLEQFSQVVICYAQSAAKIPIDWVLPLTAVVAANRLKIYKTPSSGKNAADFGITFWAGVLMQQLPQNTHFTVVSEDTDLDNVVSLLKSQGRTAERINTKKETKDVEPVNSGQTITPEAALAEYCAYLLKHNKTRPAKNDTLVNSIKTKFKELETPPQAIVNNLVKHGAIIINGTAVSYNEKMLTKLAIQVPS